MASAFETALDSAGDTVVGYATTALPIIGVVTAAWLAPKFLRRLIRGL